MIVIDDVASTYTGRPDSHRSSWARMVRCAVADMKPDDQVVLLKDGEMPAAFDQWLITYPMEFKGVSLNLPSGPQPQVLERIMRLTDVTDVSKLVSLDRPLPDYNELAVKPRFKLDEPRLKDLVGQVRETTLSDIVRFSATAAGAKPTVVLGDSHASSHYQRHTLLVRHDALPLYSALRHRFETLMPAWALDPDQCAGVKLVWGNIDIRHHLMRQDEPIKALQELLDEYHAQVTDLAQSSGQSFTIVTPLPIEHEGRRLPKTGWYKGAPFYGTREERLALVRYWWAWAATQAWHDTWHWPVSWYQMDGEVYAKQRMEKPNSVHLSPRWHLWDYDTNEPNARLIDEEWG